MCRQKLRNAVPAARQLALSCLPNRAHKVNSQLRYFAISLNKQHLLSRCFELRAAFAISTVVATCNLQARSMRSFVRHVAVACSSSGSSTGLSKQSGALITRGGSRQKIADIPRFTARQGKLTTRADLDLGFFSTDGRQHRQSIIRHWRNRSLRRFRLQPLRHLGAEADFKVASVDPHAIQNAGQLACDSYDRAQHA